MLSGPLTWPLLRAKLLVSNTTALIGSGCPFGNSLIDFVGYGTTADCFEGSSHAPAPSNTTANFRKSGGCVDTNENASDFITFAANPRNNASPVNDCATGFRPEITINDVTLAEGDSGQKSVDFTVTLSAPNNTQTVKVDFATADGTATAGSDYQSISGTVTFNPGQTTKPITVTAIGDRTTESNEIFFVNLTNSSNAVILDPQGQGTITDDDVLPTLTINDVSENEGNGGITTFHFVVGLSSPALTGGVGFDIATQDQTATVADSDYVARISTAQTIPSGQQTYAFDVTVNGDTNIEPDESFFVNVTNVSGATIGDGQGLGTIQNDDTPAMIISQIYGGGGNTGATFRNDFIEVFNRGTTTVDLTGWSIQETSATGTGLWSVTPVCPTGPCLISPGKYFLVQEAAGTGGTQNLPMPDAAGTINLSATTGKVALVANTAALSGACPATASILDMVGYGGSSATANFCFEGTGPATAPGNTTADFRKAGGCLDTNDNAADFTVSTPFPRNSASSVNNCSGGAPPNLTIDDMTVTEGDSGTITATFTVNLSAPAGGTDVTFDIATQDNTATTANNDYVAKTLTNQSILAGQQTYKFTVTVNGDTAVEPDETFFVNVTNAVGATLVDGQGVGTIRNNDSPSLSINDVTKNEGNSGTTTFTFTVSLSTPAPATATFDIGTQDNTATVADDDYVARTLTGQTISAGQQTYIFEVTVNGDPNIEPNETFFVNVTNVSGATVSDGQGQGTIQNDDSPLLVISQLYGGGGNSGAAYQNDFVELFNRGNTTVDFSITPYSVQYASAAGSFSSANKVDLTSGTVVPGQYFLIKLATGGAVGQTFAADVTNTGINMSATDGKVALIVGTTVASTTSGCPAAVTVADLVGYGSANCAETTATAALSATKVDLRNNHGCTDTNVNSADFTVTTVNTSSALPRNSNSLVTSCP